MPNRQWLWNVLNTLLGNTFTKFVQECVKAKVKHVVRKKDLCVKVLPEFAEIFKSSTNVSVQKGRFHFLIKKFGKRKWGEVEDDDREMLKKANEKVLQLNKEVEEMELQIECFKEMEEKYLANNSKLAKLYDEKIIDSDGEAIS